MTTADPPRTYHHGDLHAALLAAAEAELAETGVEGFSLRGCARRAGVSHAAPKHHFGDLTGLLTAVAIHAFDLLGRRIDAETGPLQPGTPAHLLATATGYFAFALERPELFKLMFRTERLREGDAALIAAGRTAFTRAVVAVAGILGRPADGNDPLTARRTTAFWALTHGYATLALEHQFGPRADAPAMLRDLLHPALRDLFADVAPADAASARPTVRIKAGSGPA